MARIRIVDEWLRSPVSAPSRHRAIMVVADSWGEQRVLMRAFASSNDQTRPSIVLHGVELAISPAGTDPHGEWGIHVEPPVDGRAQELREQLELAARRMAGSKGRPARLEDEAPAFERKATNNWAPGSPSSTMVGKNRSKMYEPAVAAPPSDSTVIPSAASRPSTADKKTMYERPSRVQRAAPKPPMGPANPTARKPFPAVGKVDAPTMFDTGPLPPIEDTEPAQAQPSADQSQSGFAAANAAANPAVTPPGGMPQQKAAGKPQQRRRRGWTSPLPTGQPVVDRPPKPAIGGRTALGFVPPEGSSGSIPVNQAQQPAARSLAGMVNHTMPLGFRLSPKERTVLNALGKTNALSASEVADIVGVTNGMVWMEALMCKLADHGLDLIAPGDDRAGEPTYTLRR